MKLITIADIQVKATNENLLPTAEVAKLYGVTQQAVREHKRLHSDEIIENKHFIMKINKFKKPVTYWTLEGVYMLGFFIKSERAKKYRKAVAKLLTEIKKGNLEIKPTQNSLPLQTNETIEELIKRTDIVRGYQGQIARLENELAQKQSELKNYELLLNDDLDLYFRALEALIEKIDNAQKTINDVKAILTKRVEKYKTYAIVGNGTIPLNGKYPRSRLKRILEKGE